jgi:hypothetical protein
MLTGNEQRAYKIAGSGRVVTLILNVLFLLQTIAKEYTNVHVLIIIYDYL